MNLPALGCWVKKTHIDNPDEDVIMERHYILHGALDGSAVWCTRRVIYVAGTPWEAEIIEGVHQTDKHNDKTPKETMAWFTKFNYKKVW